MRKKGFTLIELLAVIIVLAIIALIATPIIFNVIENAKIKALENSCYGIIDTVRTNYAENLLNSTDGTVKLKGSVTELTVAGEQPIQGTWEIDNTVDSNDRGIKIKDVKFASMKDYTCTNVNSDGTINSKVMCTKSGEVVRELTLREKILTEEIKGTDQTWTTAWQTSDPSGLYAQTVGSNKTYYFRGQPTNNYLKFAGKDFRILRVNEDGTIRIMLTDSIGKNEFNSTYNTYDNMYYTNSELKTAVDSWFTTNITGDNASKVVSGSYFCEAARVANNTSDYTAGNATVATSDKYTPSFNCATDGNGKGVVTSKAGLVTYDEIIYAGGWYWVSGLSYPYYLNSGSHYWTMSPAGFYSNRSANAWYVGSDGGTYSKYVGNTSGARPVLILSADTIASGSGTETDPYIVKS